MATTNAEAVPRVMVDTNVLLAATDRSRESHRAAAEFLRADERRLALSPQIVREYLAVGTRAVEHNGLGLSGADAVANIEQFLAEMELLGEDVGTTYRLLTLIGEQSAAGKQVHDANVVAVALAHGAAAVVTDNARHFARFDHLIAIEALPDS